MDEQRKRFLGLESSPNEDVVNTSEMSANSLEQGCQTHCHRGPHQPCSCLQRAECNFRTV